MFTDARHKRQLENAITIVSLVFYALIDGTFDCE